MKIILHFLVSLILFSTTSYSLQLNAHLDPSHNADMDNFSLSWRLYDIIGLREVKIYYSFTQNGSYSEVDYPSANTNLIGSAEFNIDNASDYNNLYFYVRIRYTDQDLGGSVYSSSIIEGLTYTPETDIDPEPVTPTIPDKPIFPSPSPSTVTLYSGSSVSSNVEDGVFNYYKISAGEKQTIVATLSNLDNDIDMYAKIGSKPTRDSYNCRSWNVDTQDERCSLLLNSNSDVYIGVYGFNAGNYRIKATLSGGIINKKFIPVMMDDLIIMIPAQN